MNAKRAWNVRWKNSATARSGSNHESAYHTRVSYRRCLILRYLCDSRGSQERRICAASLCRVHRRLDCLRISQGCPVISSILIEALARRAKELTTGMVARTKRHPDIADYRAAFEDELARFAITPEAQPVPAPLKRASLLPSTQPSLGRGLGQRTGGTAESDSAEAERILLMIDNVDIEIIEGVCGERAA